MQLHEGFWFALRSRSEELALGVEIEMVKRAGQAVIFEPASAAEVGALMRAVCFNDAELSV
jgi:hypothetical protein